MKNSTDSLEEYLGHWRVTPPAAPDFRHGVWRRIGVRDRISWPAYLRAHAAAWSLAAILALGAAVYTGRAVAGARVRADRETVVVNYLVDLDPRVQAGLKAGQP